MDPSLTCSFEFFPPKTPQGHVSLLRTIGALRPFNPSFVSVTSKAAPGAFQPTLDLCVRIQQEYGLPVAAHLTCFGRSRNEILHIADALHAGGIQHIIALRGDLPTDGARAPGDFPHASDLIAFLRDRKAPFRIGAACYPEAHPEATSPLSDLEWTVRKAQAGADFLLSQMFFVPRAFRRFVERIRRRGVEIPIVPGIMPITRATQTRLFAEKCHVRIPAWILGDLAQAPPDKDVSDYGVAIAEAHCRELMEHGVRSFHFYTLNGLTATQQIYGRLLVGQQQPS